MNFTGDLANFHPKTSIIFNDVTNETQICYHLVYPKDFELLKKPKRSLPANREAGNNKRRRRGRPRKEDTIKSENAEAVTVEKVDENTLKLQCSRTRSGRVSRPPKHMSKFVDIKDARTTTSTTTTITSTDVISSVDESLTPTELNSIVSADVAATNGNGVDGLAPVVQPEPKKVRKNVDRFTCSVCKKIYLGRKKLLKHYINFPDHRTTTDKALLSKPTIQTHCSNDESPANMNGSLLFDELMRMVGQTSHTERIPKFLAELSSFTSKLRSLKSRLLQTNGASREHFIDKYVSRLFDLPEGIANLDDKAFDEHSHIDDCDSVLLNRNHTTTSLESQDRIGDLERQGIIMDLGRQNDGTAMNGPSNIVILNDKIEIIGLNRQNGGVVFDNQKDALVLDNQIRRMDLDNQNDSIDQNGQNTTVSVNGQNITIVLDSQSSTIGFTSQHSQHSQSQNSQNISIGLKSHNTDVSLNSQNSTIGLNSQNNNIGLNNPNTTIGLESQNNQTSAMVSNSQITTIGLNSQNSTMGLSSQNTTIGLNSQNIGSNRQNSTIGLNSQNSTIGLNTHNSQNTTIGLNSQNIGSNSQNSTIGLNSQNSTIDLNTHNSQNTTMSLNSRTSTIVSNSQNHTLSLHKQNNLHSSHTTMILDRPNTTAYIAFTESQSSNDLTTAIANLSDLDYGLNVFQPVAYDQITDNAMAADVLAQLNESPASASDTRMLDIPMDLFSFDNMK